jgi:hypothetical protein
MPEGPKIPRERAADEPGEVVEFPGSRVRTGPGNNLPLQLSSLIGRRRERAEAGMLLADRRLLTLTGPGGSGKTRLALAVAGDVADGFEDGVWWVSLVPLSDTELVPQAVASALGVRERPGQPLTGTLARDSPPRNYCWYWTTASTWWRHARGSPMRCSAPARACASSRPAARTWG